MAFSLLSEKLVSMASATFLDNFLSSINSLSFFDNDKCNYPITIILNGML